MRLIAKKVFSPHDAGAAGGEEASHWCAERSVDTVTAIKQVTGLDAAETVENLFSEEFEIAEARARECPVDMGGRGNLDLLFWLAEHSRATQVIETGVAYGWSSLAILLSLKSRVGSTLISTDMPYPNLNNERYVGCVVPRALETNWKILKWPDREALPKALKLLSVIDMCHYDSDKSYSGRMWAYPRLWSALRQGGIFISDDIGDNCAFRDFSKSVKREPIVVKMGEKYIGVLTKS